VLKLSARCRQNLVHRWCLSISFPENPKNKMNWKVQTETKRLGAQVPGFLFAVYNLY
jgi:hypothetical protein